VRQTLKIAGQFFLALVPGIPQVARGACLWGVVLFSVFVLALDATLVAPLLNVPHISKAVLLAVVVWIVSFVDGFAHGLLYSSRRYIESKAEAFRQAHTLFLMGNLGDAEQLMLDLRGKYPLDPAVCFYLGVIYADMAKHGKAKRFFDAVRRLDEEQRWETR
jgi:hypothetical protein